VQHEAEIVLLRVVTVVHRVVEPDLVICSVADDVANDMLKALEATYA